MRSHLDVLAEIEDEKHALVEADLVSELTSDWTDGDTHLHRLRELWDEARLLPHPRTP